MQSIPPSFPGSSITILQGEPTFGLDKDQKFRKETDHTSNKVLEIFCDCRTSYPWHATFPLTNIRNPTSNLMYLAQASGLKLSINWIRLYQSHNPSQWASARWFSIIRWLQFDSWTIKCMFKLLYSLTKPSSHTPGDTEISWYKHIHGRIYQSMSFRTCNVI